MELRRFADVLRNWLWLIVGAALAGALVAAAISLNTRPVYQASARLLIQQISPASASPDYMSLLGSQMLAQTYSQMLLARPVLNQVISNLKLDSDAETLI